MARNAGSQITMNNLKLESINLTSNNLLVTIIEEKERETVLELGEAKEAEGEQYYMAKVLKAGPGFYNSGTFVKNSVNEGDVVIVSTYVDFKKANTVVEVDGMKCYFTDEDCVSAIIS